MIGRSGKREHELFKSWWMHLGYLIGRQMLKQWLPAQGFIECTIQFGWSTCMGTKDKMHVRKSNNKIQHLYPGVSSSALYNNT